LAGARFAGAATTVKTPVDFDVPRNACDCHVHIFDPAHFPYDPARVYSPPPASIAELLDLQSALHFDRVIIVTPSVYGVDNAVTLDAIRKLGPRARGVAVINASTTTAALDDMAAIGIRGVRLNLETAGESNPDVARRMLLEAAERLRGRNWHVQFNTSLKVIAALKKDIEALPFPVVIDHFGRAKATLGVDQPGLDAFLDLIRSGHAYVKISAAYRISDKPPNFPDALPIARAMVEANPDRVVWGSNWPHPGRGPSRLEIAPPHPSDDGMALDQLPNWVPDPAIRKRILVDNPARLYDFG
jgi:predicted TIM-barrel fold metal-dependent hydrolase